MTIEEFREQVLTYVFAYVKIYQEEAVTRPDDFPLEAENYLEWEEAFTRWTSKMESTNSPDSHEDLF